MDAIKEFLWTLKQNKKYQIALVSIITLTILAVIIGFWMTRSGDEEIPFFGTDTSDIREDYENQDYKTRYLDGKKVAKNEENNYPIAVMIENLVTVRPQSGLSKAQLVYEALAEGGITRFMAVYAEEDLLMEEVGPVRSARPYFVDWADEFAAVYMHAGGSPQALGQIPETDLIDVNQIGGDQGFFWRKQEVAAPHNLFTSGELMTFVRRDKDVPEEGKYEPWLFKTEKDIGERPEQEKTISIDFSTFSYKVEYTYDRETNDYLRSNGGEAHLDALTGEQIRAKNIVVQKTKTGLIGDGSGRLDITTTGNGDAMIFMDGEVIEGAWEKNKEGERTRFYASTGEEIEFNPGTTWIEVIPTDREVIYN